MTAGRDAMTRHRFPTPCPRAAGVSKEEVQPWHRLGGVEHVCELRKTAQVLYAIFVSVLRTVYAGRKGRTFGCPDVVWSPDAQKTQLWIDTELRWEDQRPDFTPAIYVGLGEIAYEPAPSMDMMGGMDMNRFGERHYERTGKGTARLLHVADKAGAACSLADNTEAWISSLQAQLCEEYCFDRLAVAGRQPRQRLEQPPSAGKGLYASSVALQFEFTDAWAVKHETPILKTVAAAFDGGRREAKVCGTAVDVSGGVIEIDFGGVAAETDVPVEA